ncbi:hypothetical protein B0H17DRAFT_1033035 [Mycena rosella]|uniref:Uncharacterized protein n=1 Tax=Mycena rosella TaxID=1033263 RepID=A0AAD7GY00_MYCRO|nr:hypothetical protein B0H17DRAFT_1033035 [Mycena rosella]
MSVFFEERESQQTFCERILSTILSSFLTTTTTTTMSSSSNSNSNPNAGSGSSTGQSYTVTGSGTNSQGNHYCTRESSGGSGYHYSNT